MTPRLRLRVVCLPEGFSDEGRGSFPFTDHDPTATLLGPHVVPLKVSANFAVKELSFEHKTRGVARSWTAGSKPSMCHVKLWVGAGGS